MASSNYEYEKFLPQDSFIMRDKLIEENPHIHLFIKDSLIMNDKDKFYIYKNDDLLSVEVNGSTVNISSKLVYDFITNEGMYKYLLSSLNRDYETAISIQLFNDGLFADNIKFTKAEFVSALKQIDATELPDVCSLRMVVVYSLTDETVMVNNYHDQMYTCMIDGKEEQINAIELVKILTSTNKEFRRFCSGKEEYPYSKEIMAYMLVDFCEKEGIFNKYILDSYIYERFKSLKNYELIDFESIDKNNKSDDELPDGKSLLDDFNINPELMDAIKEDMNPEYNTLEKAIYIYIRLCDLLTYDEEQVASNSNYEKTGTHTSIENIYNITPENNKVVSYEFVLLYSKILRELGIKYASNLSSMGGYVSGKSSLKFKHGEYLVKVDLFSNLIKNDMTMVKIGGTINSIKSVNKNEMSHRKFEELVYDIYSSYKDTCKRREEFLDNVRQYKRTYFKSTVSKKDRLFMLFKLIARKDLNGMDSINYIKESMDRIIGEDESLTFNILAKNKGLHSQPIVVISMVTPDDIYYYLIDTNNEETVRLLTFNQIKRLLATGQIYFIDNERLNGSEEGMNYARKTKK